MKKKSQDAADDDLRPEYDLAPLLRGAEPPDIQQSPLETQRSSLGSQQPLLEAQRSSLELQGSSLDNQQPFLGAKGSLLELKESFLG